MTDKIRLENASPAQYDFSVVGANLGITKVGGNGNVGIGTTTPSNTFTVFGSSGTTQIMAEDTLAGPGDRVLFRLKAASKIRFSLNNTAAGVVWTFDNDGNFTVSDAGDGVNEMTVFPNGNVTILGTLTQGSDVNTKQDFEKVSATEILDKVAGLDILKWAYKEAPAARHIGPTSQDFHSKFGLGDTDKGIATIDADGVSLASIQALYQLVQEQRKEIEALRTRVEELAPKR
jgi:hypothetical protein